ncbi:unnamed protein product [Chondrus crispus]|uniref:Uncharacterized protein n=1 Tax=Chondrus crispus TaxID=2769 RepID=R7QJS5_CHOCR|nr:unnamed protein product [Chondrus crispus]CDF38344.1 unnamed protein product [Chondrus crispus]|eukprot:XP_005718229.1 unnamed protein product [Chondrus crispus]
MKYGAQEGAVVFDDARVPRKEHYVGVRSSVWGGQGERMATVAETEKLAPHASVACEDFSGGQGGKRDAGFVDRDGGLGAGGFSYQPAGS